MMTAGVKAALCFGGAVQSSRKFLGVSPVVPLQGCKPPLVLLITLTTLMSTGYADVQPQELLLLLCKINVSLLTSHPGEISPLGILWQRAIRFLLFTGKCSLFLSIHCILRSCCGHSRQAKSAAHTFDVMGVLYELLLLTVPSGGFPKK